MKRAGTKLVRVEPEDVNRAPGYFRAPGYAHWCPGCHSPHEYAVDAPFSNGARWIFDGNVEAPSFSPSMNIQVNPRSHAHYAPEAGSSACHYFVTAGRIIYCADTTHALSGQTVDLPDFPDITLRMWGI